MRIAQVAPPFVSVPPRRYGGTERVVHTLTEELVRRGHAVTVFAAAGSDTSAELHVCAPAPLWELRPQDPLAYRVVQVEEVVRRSAEFDVIHSHVDYLPWLAAGRLRAPVVTTLHGRLDLPEWRRVLATFVGWPLVSISHAQRRPVSDLDLNWVGTVHNGLDLGRSYRLGRGEGGFLVFLGRISPEKGPDAAIRVAVAAGIRLMMAARVDPTDRSYFEERVRPLLRHPLVEWVGELDDRAKADLLGSARALLMPIEWDEPFGLAFIEAMAAGCPVISRPRGSLPELVRHGEHGFLCTTEAEMVVACQRVGSLDRAACRRWVLERFSGERMTSGYEDVYDRVALRRPEVALTVAG